MTPDLRRGRHCIFALNVHLVFLTKYRRSIFTDEHLMTIRASAEKVCGDFGASLREFNGERNHVHLLVS
ncbi:IS200/IS605 family transposase, partial [Sutterella wadsworthensis]